MVGFVNEVRRVGSSRPHLEVSKMKPDLFQCQEFLTLEQITNAVSRIVHFRINKNKQHKMRKKKNCSTF